VKGISEMSAISQWEVSGLWVMLKRDGNKTRRRMHFP